MNLAAAFTSTAGARPDGVALVLGSSRLTYGDVDDASRRVASLLRAGGLVPGDAVGVMLPDVPQFVDLYYGILRAGGVVVPMNPLLQRHEVAYSLRDSGARTLFAWRDLLAEAQAGAGQARVSLLAVDAASFGERLAEFPADPVLLERDAEDTAVLRYTFGSTGEPSDAVLTHASLRGDAAASARSRPIDPGDVVPVGIPLFRASGQRVLTSALGVGATVVLPDRVTSHGALRAIDTGPDRLGQEVAAAVPLPLGAAGTLLRREPTPPHCEESR